MYCKLVAKVSHSLQSNYCNVISVTTSNMLISTDVAQKTKLITICNNMGKNNDVAVDLDHLSQNFPLPNYHQLSIMIRKKCSILSRLQNCLCWIQQRADPDMTLQLKFV